MNKVRFSSLSMPVIVEANYLFASKPFLHMDEILPFNIFIFVLKGEVSVVEECPDEYGNMIETEYVARPGDILFLKSSLHHYGRHKVPEGASWYYVHFKLPEYFPGESGTMELPKSLCGLLGSSIERKTADFVESFNNPSAQSKWEIPSRFFNVLSDVAFYSKDAVSRKERLVDRIEQFLDMNVSRPFDSKELEGAFNLNSKYLEKIFKDQKGCSLVRFHTRLRMERAGTLLRTSDASVGEIACELGYTDSFYFSRLFTRAYGKSPSDYRRDARVSGPISSFEVPHGDVESAFKCRL